MFHNFFISLLQDRLAEFNCKGKDVHVEVNPNGLIAVQGPQMAKALQPGVDVDLTKLTFMTSTLATVFGVPDCRITRCGYTGEDGVEVSENYLGSILENRYYMSEWIENREARPSKKVNLIFIIFGINLFFLLDVNTG